MKYQVKGNITNEKHRQTETIYINNRKTIPEAHGLELNISLQRIQRSAI